MGDKFQIADSDIYVSFYGHDEYPKASIKFDSTTFTVPFAISGAVTLPYAKTVATPADVGGIATVNLGDVVFKIKATTIDTTNYVYEITEYKFPGMDDYRPADSTYIATTDGDLSIESDTDKNIMINIDRDSAGTYEIVYDVDFTNIANNEMLLEFNRIEANSDILVSKYRDINMYHYVDTTVTPNKTYIAVTLDSDENVYVPVDFAAGELNLGAVNYTYATGMSETFDPETYTKFYSESFDEVSLSLSSVAIDVYTKKANAYPWVGIPGGTEEQANTVCVKPGETITVGDATVKVLEVKTEEHLHRVQACRGLEPHDSVP